MPKETKNRKFSKNRKIGKHVKNCDCPQCAKVRAQRWLEFIERCERLRPRPENLSQTVYVKAHFRKNPRHFDSKPRTRALVRQYMRGLLTRR